MWNMPPAGLIVTIAIIVLGIVDLFFVLLKGTGNSISNYLINAGFKSPIIVFAFGFIAGHLFGYMSPVSDPTWYTPGFNLYFSLAVFGFGSLMVGASKLYELSRKQ